MKKGKLINFVLLYARDGVGVPAAHQAEKILQKGRELMQSGSKGVAITYSANYGQTRDIQQTYFKGDWKTGVDGANQAAVMTAMEELLEKEYTDLQGHLHILPVTTMNAYQRPVDPWNEGVLMGIVTTDLDRIQTYLEAGWDVLGWQNQSTVNQAKHPYAIGGGIAQLPKSVSEKIQQTLIAYAKAYPC